MGPSAQVYYLEDATKRKRVRGSYREACTVQGAAIDEVVLLANRNSEPLSVLDLLSCFLAMAAPIQIASLFVSVWGSSRLMAELMLVSPRMLYPSLGSLVV